RKKSHTKRRYLCPSAFKNTHIFEKINSVLGCWFGQKIEFTRTQDAASALVTATIDRQASLQHPIGDFRKVQFAVVSTTTQTERCRVSFWIEATKSNHSYARKTFVQLLKCVQHQARRTFHIQHRE